ncbi:MAG: protein translocase subunit SecF [Candidatus Liptonbacteria bacterium]|nr:protein translocase subunit SecF [Candidatus Liptonbacteria bacterium]
MLNVIRHRRIFLTIGIVFVGASLVSIAVFGFRQGIDFQGGTLWQFRAGDPGAEALREVRGVLEKDLGYPQAIVNYSGGGGIMLARLPVVDEPAHQRDLAAMRERFPEFQELSFQTIGPSIGKELRKNAVIALILVLVGISLYVAFAFRKASRPVASWKYGAITLVTLFHDVLVPAGLLALLGFLRGVEIDSNFVVALLVVMGFSVHDTIVVFDRVREHLGRDRGAGDFGDVVNASVRQTLRRSVYTSLTLIFVLLALIVAGPQNLFYFLLTLLVGVTAGTYSSIFLASPALFLVGQSKGRGK